MSDFVLEAITRWEQYKAEENRLLEQIAAGGGGGGGGLPPATTADNGKVLRVVNGAAAWDETATGNLCTLSELIIDITTLPVSYSQLKTMFAANPNLYFVYDNGLASGGSAMVYRLLFIGDPASMTANGAVFVSGSDQGSPQLKMVTFTDDGNGTLTYTNMHTVSFI